MQDPFSHLGNGIRFPLRRTGGDFESSSGVDLVLSSLPYILLTGSDGPSIQGEQPWDTGFGSQLLRMKFSSLSGEELRAFVDHYVVESMLICEPRVLIEDVDVIDDGNKKTIRVFASALDQDIDANDVRIQPGSVFDFDLPF